MRRRCSVATRSQTKNRVYKMLEDTNIKVASVVTDLFGVSGRRTLTALLAGARDPHRLAALARDGRHRRERGSCWHDPGRRESWVPLDTGTRAA
jgi:hypothetical protein